jgi:hypothetical protein
MRNRQLSPTGDYTGFSGATVFLVNSAAAVAQAIMTKLNLWQDQWFLDSTVGVPYMTQVVGKGTANVRDVAIQSAILNTPGVSQIISYASQFGIPGPRGWSVQARVLTIYSTVPVPISI